MCINKRIRLARRAWEEEKRRDRERKEKARQEQERAQKMAQERLIEKQERDIELDGAE